MSAAAPMCPCGCFEPITGDDLKHGRSIRSACRKRKSRALAIAIASKEPRPVEDVPPPLEEDDDITDDAAPFRHVHSFLSLCSNELKTIAKQMDDAGKYTMQHCSELLLKIQEEQKVLKAQLKDETERSKRLADELAACKDKQLISIQEEWLWAVMGSMNCETFTRDRVLEVFRRSGHLTRIAGATTATAATESAADSSN